jgi:hypothetical protein
MRSGEVTFGCLNNFAKASAPALALWAKILHRPLRGPWGRPSARCGNGAVPEETRARAKTRSAQNRKIGGFELLISRNCWGFAMSAVRRCAFVRQIAQRAGEDR